MLVDGEFQPTVTAEQMTDVHCGVRSTPQWKELGFRPIKGETPHQIEEYTTGRRRVVCYYWREDQVVQIKRRVTKEDDITAANVIAAMKSVNNAAKNFRDRKEACWDYGKYNACASYKAKQHHAYYLKDEAIMWLARHGALQPVARHAGMISWAGDGVSVHSFIAPKNWKDLPERPMTGDYFRADAKEKQKGDWSFARAERLIKRLTIRGFAALDSHIKDGLIRLEKPARKFDWDDDDF